jgi:hypothetical protein
VTGYELDDDVVLFLQHTGELIRLNPTAALVWRGLESGLSTRAIIDSLVHVLDIPPVQVEQDVAGFVTSLEETGALGRQAPSHQAAQPTRKGITNLTHFRGVSRPQLDIREGCYRLVDFNFRLRVPETIASETDQLLAHLSMPANGSSEALLEVFEDGNQWLLLRDGDVVDRCSSAAGVIPMLHSSILLMSYRASRCMAALHAAVVTRGDHCVVMPAVSGSGKSTLTAALLAHGFGYCADDLALLTHEPVRIRPVPTCLGLKPGSWSVLDRAFPEIRHLPTYVRADGKRVRYLRPGSVEGSHHYKATAIVFPCWSSGDPAQIRGISSGEALSRLTASGYDLKNRINREVIECLIRWIADLPSFEVRYDAPQDVAALIGPLMP